MYLLDTNIVIAILNRKLQVTPQQEASPVLLSSIVLGELYLGAHRSARTEENLRRLEVFAAGYPILGCDQETAERYGQIKSRLLSKGSPLPENDIWIAATAVQHGLTLVTRDKHFDAIEGLSTESW